MSSGIYHVLNRGLNNSCILSKGKDREYFIELLDVQRRDFTLSVYHYWSRWGNEDEERKKKYAAYILLDDAEDAKLFTGRTAVIGDDEFKARVRMNCGRPTTRCAGRPRKIQ